MAKRERDDRRRKIAMAFLETYGEAIDCDEISRVVRPLNIVTNRLLSAVDDQLPAFADLLDRQATELESFFTKRLRGHRTESLRSLMLEVKRVAKLAGKQAPIPFPFKLAGEHANLAKRLAGSARVQAKRRVVLRARRLTRSPDLNLGWAATDVAEWIRQRHRGRNGDLDGKVRWEDVALVLAWHRVPGCKSSSGDAAGVLRKQSKRYLATLDGPYVIAMPEQSDEDVAALFRARETRKARPTSTKSRLQGRRQTRV